MRASVNTNIAYGEWLNTMPWDSFTTVTYRHPITARRNYAIMSDLEQHLKSKLSSFALFWAMETTNPGETHNHMLIRNMDATKHIDNLLLSKNLIWKQGVKHLPYDPAQGASYYVSKYIKRPNAQYDFILQ